MGAPFFRKDHICSYCQSLAALGAKNALLVGNSLGYSLLINRFYPHSSLRACQQVLHLTLTFVSILKIGLLLFLYKSLEIV